MKCIHHNDLDGHGAASIVAFYENNFNPEDYIEADYTSDFPFEKFSEGEKVYIVDYSFDSGSVGKLDKLLKITDNIIWVDHHQSSLELLKKRIDLKSIKGNVFNGISGAALTYMYLYSKNYEDIPLYLKYVSDFDCWHLKMPKVMEFKYGVEGNDYKVLDDIWKRFFYDTDGSFLEEIITFGTSAKKYVEHDFADYLEKYSYETTVDGLKCLAVNRRTFSAIFGNKINDYPLCMIWVYDGKIDKYIYSIFSVDASVDCSKIAEKFGGGGHKGASGFSSKKYMF